MGANDIKIYLKINCKGYLSIGKNTKKYKKTNNNWPMKGYKSIEKILRNAKKKKKKKKKNKSNWLMFHNTVIFTTHRK